MDNILSGCLVTSCYDPSVAAYFQMHFLYVSSYVSNWQEISIGLGDGLGLNRQKPLLELIMAQSYNAISVPSLGLDKFIHD